MPRAETRKGAAVPISASAAQRGNPYENPELLRWLDSYEGLPDVADPGESAAEQRSRAGARAYELFGLVGAVLPGFALAAGIAALAGVAAEGIGRGLLGFERSPVPGVALAILLGLGIRNGVGLPVVYDAGLRLCVKRLLRVGVALLGIRLSLATVGVIGVAALPIVLGAVAAALLSVTWLGRLLGLPRRLSLLIAVGTGICGNTAILATGPVIDADEDEISYAVACVTIFGLLALLLHPPLAHLLFAGDAQRVGLFLGTAIHDTAQVAGAALLYAQQYGAPEALDVATVTKLLRNLFLLAVIPLAALLHRRETPGTSGPLLRTPLLQLVPLFVLGFVAMTAVRTIGDLGDRPFGLLTPESWHAVIATASDVSHWCLALAMAAIGLGTSFAKLRVLGARPFGVGMIAAAIVGVASYVLVRTTA
jgi:uncharacterized integral membrane protein (TIGR00698 family)